MACVNFVYSSSLSAWICTKRVPMVRHA
jgi:hypothetical protein